MNGKIQHAKFFGPVMDGGTGRRIITKKAWWENGAKNVGSFDFTVLE